MATRSEPVRTSYESNEVEIPADYLRSTPDDAQPITFRQIDFKNSPLPEYDGCYAAVLDHVLSPSECTTLIQLAESSVPSKDKSSNNGDPWRPALVNVGGGYEVLAADYRNSDRIIWDSQEIVDRLWARLATAPGIGSNAEGEEEADNASSSSSSLLHGFNELELGGGGPKRKDRPGSDWKFHRVNKRMRFLRYGGGQFFRPHCDGAYGETDAATGRVLRTHFTVHVYLNDSRAENAAAELEGGATSFLSSDETRRVDLEPRAGRVLIFQHRRLYHSGDDVREGTKFTVRTDIMYELVR